MKLKKYKEKYSNKVSKKPVINRKYVDYKWVFIITVLAFIISLVFSFISELTIPNANMVVASILIILFIGIGIIFDMIGIAVTVADIKTFNSMATKRVRGAKLAVKLIKNASRTSSFCNDVIGDICGIVSGSILSSLVVLLLDKPIVSILLTAIVSSFTVGGKAFGKMIAIERCQEIVFVVGKILSKIPFISKK